MTTRRDTSGKRRRATRRGFTLIELLLVMVLIAFLAGLVLYAVNLGLVKGRTTRIVTEIDQLNTAVERYKTERGSYPPTMGTFPGDQNPPLSAVAKTDTTSQVPGSQQLRVQRHLAKAFPRYIGTYTTFRTQVAAATNGLDVDNLDPAESLVFWLGGMPDLTAEQKLVGFGKDPANPFNYSTNSGSPPAFFPFDPRRLVDRDKDGWWEYIPAGAKDDDNGPPLVYFDGNSYTSKAGPCYPYLGTGTVSADQQVLINQYALTWGYCVPYGSELKLPTNTPPGITWMNSQKFQILSAGLDNVYSEGRTTSNDVFPNYPWYEVDFWPSGLEYDINSPTKNNTSSGFHPEERDNLSNFAPGRLGDSLP